MRLGTRKAPIPADLISRVVDSMIPAAASLLPLRTSDRWEPGGRRWDQADMAARVARLRRLNDLGPETKDPKAVRIVPAEKVDHATRPEA